MMNKPAINRQSLRRPALFLIFILLPILFTQCLERERDNPFDPINNQTPLSLQLKPGNLRISLNWNFTRPITDYQGFRLYRAVGTTENFTLFSQLPGNQFAFVDTSISAGQWYYYKVSVLGDDVESLPSNTSKTYLGPGEYWVLSEDGYVLKKISYDLINTIFSRDLYLRTTDWSVAIEDSAIWLSYPQYTKSISKFSMTSGQEELHYPEGLQGAIDVAYNPLSNVIYILDRSNASILVYSGNSVVGQIPINSEARHYRIKYFQRLNKLFVLGESQLLVISVDNNQYPGETLDFPPGYTGLDFDFANAKAYVLIASESGQQSAIYTINDQSAVEDTLQLNGIFYRMCVDDLNSWFYAAEDVSSGNDKVLQLSYSGNRQIELTGFKFVEQIAVNPYDRSIIVVDYSNNLLSLYDVEGNFISSSEDFEGRKYLSHPFRVFVE
jgi:DNA-binding beta-propeller fold protein YncE